MSINASLFLQDSENAESVEGVWVDFEIESGAMARIKIRPLFIWKAKEIAKAAKSKVNKKISDDKKADRLTVNWLVEDWEGFLDSNGKGIPCTKENREMLYKNWPAFFVFVQQTGVNLESESRPEAEKN